MKILVTGALGATAEELDRLAAAGHTVTLHREEAHPVPDPGQYEAVICNSLFVHHDMGQFTSLRYIQLTSAGLDRVPLDEIRRRGIALHNAGGVYAVPMAEFALCGVLQLYKQSRFFGKNQAAHRWEKHRGLRELSGKRVCIVGCGGVGEECALRFRAFGCHVTGVNRTPREGGPFDERYPLTALKQALGEADIVVLSLALTEDTRHLIDRAHLSAMKEGAVLVNLARGAIADTPALIEALRSRLGGAVLDVFEEEPLSPDSPLWEMDHVILTPHNSFVGEGNHGRMMAVVEGNLKRFTNHPFESR